ncbi:MAG: hypothetical protein IKK45_00035 [Akkermansia sp.]|nr:hypothetical protein [Akkermansia sp.]
MEDSDIAPDSKIRMNSKKVFVLYADIMGFRARVKSKSHANLVREMGEFIDQLRHQSKQFFSNNHLNYTIFSDSIIISTDDATVEGFNLITKAGARMMHIALRLGIPLKGAISKGEYTCWKEKGLYLGEALVDAYELHEEIKYYGIVVHHSAEENTKRYINDEKNRHLYMNTPVSLKSGKISHYHLCWNLISEKLCFGDITKTATEWLNKISETVSGAPRIYIDNTHAVLQADSKAYKNFQKTQEE